MLDFDRAIVDLGAGAGAVHVPLKERGFRYYGMDAHPEALRLMRDAGIDAFQCDLNDPTTVIKNLNDIEDDVGGLLMLDVIEHLVEPQRLLSELSSWARSHGSPHLLVSVPNVAHFDVAVRLLMGRWDPTRTGLLDSTHLRFFYRETLMRMLARSGWKVVAENDVHVIHSDQYAPELVNQIPPALAGALRVLSDNFNGYGTVQQFVWALAPVGVPSPPQSYLDAVGGEAAREPGADDDEETKNRRMRAVADYMSSVGLYSLEFDGRAMVYAAALEGDLRRAGEEIERKNAYIARTEEYALRTEGYAVQLQEQVRELAQQCDSAQAERDASRTAATEMSSDRDQLAAQLAEAQAMIGQIRRRRSYRLTVGLVDRLRTGRR